MRAPRYHNHCQSEFLRFWSSSLDGKVCAARIQSSQTVTREDIPLKAHLLIAAVSAFRLSLAVDHLLDLWTSCLVDRPVSQPLYQNEQDWYCCGQQGTLSNHPKNVRKHQARRSSTSNDHIFNFHVAIHIDVPRFSNAFVDCHRCHDSDETKLLRPRRGLT